MIDFTNVGIFFLAGVAGYALAGYFAGKREGETGMFPSLRIPVGKYWLHIHHWLIALVAVTLSYQLDFDSVFLSGALVGIIAQGLTYRDFYRIIYLR